jgi:hypothetical protein
MTGLEDAIPSKKRLRTIGHNSMRSAGVEDGPLRDTETGKFTKKKFRGVPKK